MMKLYYAPGACSLATHIVAAEGGVKLDLEKVDLKAHQTEGGADFYKINPKGYVPALQLDDGSLLTENVALLIFMGDKAGLTPKDEMKRYRLLEWLAFISTEIHKSFSPLFGGASDELKQKAQEKIVKRLAYVNEEMSGDYLMGAHFGPADAYLYVTLRWAEKLGIDISGLTNITGLKERIAKRAGVREALSAEGIS